jgi:hypothetical protein
VPPPGSYIEELVARVRVPSAKCEHLRIPAKEARDRLAETPEETRKRIAASKAKKAARG